jgi:anti-sigma B factor antagonist
MPVRVQDATIPSEFDVPQAWLDDAHAVVEVSGDLDLYSVPRVREALVDLHRAGRFLIAVDMSAVEFMDSSGLGVLLGGLKRAWAAGGVLVLIGPPECVLRVLRITGVVRVLPVVATVGEAFVCLDEVAAR